MAIQLSEALQGLANLRIDIADVESSVFIQWCDFINKRAYRLLKEIDSERFVSEQTYNVSGDSEQTLPADFRTIVAADTGFFVTDSNGDVQYELLNRPFSSVEPGYFIKKNTVRFRGVNSSNVLLRYLPKQTKLTSLNDYFTLDGTETGDEIIPDEFLELLVADLDVLYSKWDESPGESLSDFRYSRLLSEMTNNYERDIKVIF